MAIDQQSLQLSLEKILMSVHAMHAFLPSFFIKPVIFIQNGNACRKESHNWHGVCTGLKGEQSNTELRKQAR